MTIFHVYARDLTVKQIPYAELYNTYLLIVVLTYLTLSSSEISIIVQQFGISVAI